MSELVKELFELTLAVASGQLSVGENAGHSQVSIWRNWAQTDNSFINELKRQGVMPHIPSFRTGTSLEREEAHGTRRRRKKRKGKGRT